MPSSVTRIERLAFCKCSDLKVVVVIFVVDTGGSSSLQEIDDRAFMNCHQLSYIKCCDYIISQEQEKQLLHISNKNLKNNLAAPSASMTTTATTTTSTPSTIELPNSLKKIGSYTFSVCKTISSIVIPDSVIQIDKYAFAKCYQLSYIRLPGITLQELSEGVLQYTKLKNISLPPSLWRQLLIL